ncbi:HDOD domain-containing protein [Thiohalophilus sp.]|uniref:HDOD domain-containing protein n=1 Tax=Thiohalophilus sp. TaxID=3028392 RepID=UPI002ACEFE20|nr:HDOD domain-containing protein [Thiohalophilus sp.]MDZ7805092.1 HDOD domain-containing protein [Thiohalophilus sp.]
MSLQQEFINQLLSDLKNDKLVLPTLPEVALKVRDTLEDDNASLVDVARVVTSDTALSARLIQVANSPLLRANRQIETVEAAVTRMGSNMVRNLVTSIAMEQMFQATSDITDKRLRHLWEHSTEVAAISSALAHTQPGLQPDHALLAGLVHDIGALPILSRVEDYPELLEDEPTLDTIIATAHPKLGEAILKAWNFPADIIAAASDHENLERDHDGPADYTDLVIVANLQSLLGTSHPHTELDWSKVPAFAKLGLEPDVSIVDIEVGQNVDAVKAALSTGG